MPSEEEKKIHTLEERIVQLEQALQEKEAANTTAMNHPQVTPLSPQPPVASNQPPQTSPFQTVPPSYVPPISPQYHNNTSQSSISQQPTQSMDMEQKFGRIVMGILASVFIFAAILIGYAFLPGWIQAVGLYIIGIAVSAIGLYGIAKKIIAISF